MVPAANVAIVGSWGLLLAILGRLVPGIGRGPLIFLLSNVAFLGPLLAIPGIRASACLALAVGLAAWTGPIVRAAPEPLPRLVRRGRWGLVLVFFLLVGITVARDRVAERLAWSRLTAPPPGAPNVLLIVMDTVRADATSLHGHHRDTTPNLVKLASQSVRFQRAVAPSPWTLPSHASLFTGRWPRELSVGPDRALDAESPTLAEYLRDRGYATAGFVANTVFCSREYGLARGFVHYEDHVLSVLEIIRSSALGWLAGKSVAPLLDQLLHTMGREPRHAWETDTYRKDAARINRDALRWIEQNRQRPFFVFLNYLDAHDPYVTPPGFTPRFGTRPKTPSQYQLLRRWSADDLRTRDPAAIRLARDEYDDCLAYLDMQIGKLLARLDHLGLVENTLVIVTSDHGEHFGEHRHGGQMIFGHRKSLYQPEVHVPLLVSWPGVISAPTRRHEPVSLRDVPATVVELLGLGGESPFPGTSLLTRANARASNPAGSVLAEFAYRADIPALQRYAGAAPGLLRAVLEGNLVYHRLDDGNEELYDLSVDPGEQHNLAPEDASAQILERFRLRLDRLDPSKLPLPAITARPGPHEGTTIPIVPEGASARSIVTGASRGLPGTESSPSR
jgi:arylsulfatase A-like enzyme